MTFSPILLEEWFDKYQYEVKYDIAESGMKCVNLKSIDLDLSEVIFRYGFHTGPPELRRIISKDYPNISYEQVMVTNGAIEANFLATAALVEPGDHVVVEHPNYPQLYETPRALGCKVDFWHLRYEKNYVPEIEELQRIITNRTKLIIISHPNNPTGSMITLDLFKKILDLAEDRNIYLLSDEIYRELCFTEPLPPAASLSSKAISTSSVSKLYGLPGVRIGWLVADKSIVQKARTIKEYVSICNTSLGEAIAKRVLENKRNFLDQAKRLVKENYKIVERWIKQRPDLEWIAPSGGVVAFPKYSYSIPSTDLCRTLIKEYKTMLVPGSCFGIENHFRIGFGGDAQELRMGLQQVNKALDKMRQK